MTYSQVIIIGFGPAGMACAIQLKRMGISPLVIEKGEPGGMLPNASLVENYMGFPNGISGEKLTELFRDQAIRFDIIPVRDQVKYADYSDGRFFLDGHLDSYQCSVLVIAAGTEPLYPEGIPAELVSRGFIHTDISALKQVEGKTIGIIGAGDAAFDYALSLNAKSNEIHIFNRTSQVKALHALQQRMIRADRVRIHENHTLESIKTLHGKELNLVFRENMQVREFVVDYLIFATGRVPACSFLGSELKKHSDRLETDCRLFFIGDARNGIFRQLSVAVGDGIKAAMEIFQHEGNHTD